MTKDCSHEDACGSTSDGGSKRSQPQSQSQQRPRARSLRTSQIEDIDVSQPHPRPLACIAHARTGARARTEPTFAPRIRGRSPEVDANAEHQGAQAVLDWEEGIACIHPASAHAALAQRAQEVTEAMPLAERRSALSELTYCSRTAPIELLRDWLVALFARPLPAWLHNDAVFSGRVADARAGWEP